MIPTITNAVFLGGEGGENWQWVLESLSYEGVTLESKKISFKQSLIYIHPLPQFQPNFFIWLSSQKKIILR